MHDLNRVQRIGHLGQDPEVTYTATGTARTTFTVVTSACWKDADGQHRMDALCGVGRPGRGLAQYVTKRSRVYVAGQLPIVHCDHAETGECWWPR